MYTLSLRSALMSMCDNLVLLTFRLWRKIINERRLFWQLSKNIAKSEVIKRKRRAKVTEKVDLSKAARDIRRQANKFKRKRLI